MSRVKLEVRFEHLAPGSLGAVTSDGIILISPKVRRRPLLFLEVFIHELIHWTLDALFYPYKGCLHYWNDLVYSFIGLFSVEVDRRNIRLNIRLCYLEKKYEQTSGRI